MKTDLEHNLVYPIADAELERDSDASVGEDGEDRFLGRNIGGGHGVMKLSHDRIPGWGTDLARNRPRNMQPEEPHPIVGQEALPVQPPTVEVLLSTERPGLTPLFGTSVPPSGISGVLRRMAYKQSENDIRRWLMLMFSDRVDVVEGIGADLCEGRIPNIFQEMGLRAAWKHDRAGLLRKTAVTAAALGLVVYLARRH